MQSVQANQGQHFLLELYLLFTESLLSADIQLINSILFVTVYDKCNSTVITVYYPTYSCPFKWLSQLGEITMLYLQFHKKVHIHLWGKKNWYVFSPFSIYFINSSYLNRLYMELEPVFANGFFDICLEINFWKLECTKTTWKFSPALQFTPSTIIFLVENNVLTLSPIRSILKMAYATSIKPEQPASNLLSV